MCVSPKRLDALTEVPCQGCWQCQDNRINDLVGRCVAEQHVSDQAFSVTLTYAGDTPNAAVLCYRDVQLFLKRLRKAGYDVRYIVAGEYGTKKGRAHWHIVLFFKGKALEIVEAGKRVNDWQVVLPRFDNDAAARISFAPWSDPSEGRGFCYFQHPDYGGFRYAMKYALKQQGNDAAVKSLSMSKRPPLGHAFFMRMADDLVEQRLPVQLPTYAFKGVLDSKGKHRRFCLQGRMRAMFLDRYHISWRLLHGGAPPASPWFQEKYLDKIENLRAAWDVDLNNEAIRLKGLDFKMRARVHAARESAKLAAYEASKPAWVPEGVIRHEFTLGPWPRWRNCSIVAYPTFVSINLDDGCEPWLIGATDRETLESLLLEAGLKRSALGQVCDWLLWRWSL